MEDGQRPGYQPEFAISTEDSFPDVDMGELTRSIVKIHARGTNQDIVALKELNDQSRRLATGLSMDNFLARYSLILEKEREMIALAKRIENIPVDETNILSLLKKGPEITSEEMRGIFALVDHLRPLIDFLRIQTRGAQFETEFGVEPNELGDYYFLPAALSDGGQIRVFSNHHEANTAYNSLNHRLFIFTELALGRDFICQAKKNPDIQSQLPRLQVSPLDRFRSGDYEIKRLISDGLSANRLRFAAFVSIPSYLDRMKTVFFADTNRPLGSEVPRQFVNYLLFLRELGVYKILASLTVELESLSYFVSSEQLTTFLGKNLTLDQIIEVLRQNNPDLIRVIENFVDEYLMNMIATGYLNDVCNLILSVYPVITDGPLRESEIKDQSIGVLRFLEENPDDPVDYWFEPVIDQVVGQQISELPIPLAQDSTDDSFNVLSQDRSSLVVVELDPEFRSELPQRMSLQRKIQQVNASLGKPNNYTLDHFFIPENASLNARLESRPAGDLGIEAQPLDMALEKPEKNVLFEPQAEGRTIPTIVHETMMGGPMNVDLKLEAEPIHDSIVNKVTNMTNPDDKTAFNWQTALSESDNLITRLLPFMTDDVISALLSLIANDMQSAQTDFFNAIRSYKDSNPAMFSRILLVLPDLESRIIPLEQCLERQQKNDLTFIVLGSAFTHAFRYHLFNRFVESLQKVRHTEPN